MDSELRDLERAVQAAPQDVTLARQYEAALLRAGRRDAVHQLYRFKFACPVRWGSFTIVGDGVGHCAECDRNVHFVETEEELARHVDAGDCIAVDVERLADAIDGLVDHPLYHAAKEAQPTCLVETRAGEVRPAVPGGITRLLPPSPEPTPQPRPAPPGD